ncbi:cobalamin biosynthesis protein [Fusibacter ferrireducens]|uniref:Cobalamin biosynthesis protein n=1 Tax=Fusibacter ferrireducens TaxID=2785058 RepID=A0ABR9ZS19_9FIRM|nr:cobalamin biosynthesis protein [Fusibacter ferrireducens]MBF4693252.1 cobalamin biosynthesis protein [Fusibacter ferrireducens]
MESLITIQNSTTRTLSMNLDHKPHFVFFALTEKGQHVMTDLENLLKIHFVNCDEAFLPTYKAYSPAELKALGGLKEVVAQTFEEIIPPSHSAYDNRHQTILVFTCAVGIAVRMLAPHLKDKLKDPACIVIDDHARFAISLLSGHIGKANAYTTLFAECLKEAYQTVPVITTATDIRGIQGFEEVMSFFKISLEKNRPAIKVLNTALANDQTIGLLLDPMLRISKSYDSNAITVYEESRAFFEHTGPKAIITLRKPELWINPLYDDDCFIFYSQSLVVGTGCRKELPFEDYFKQLLKALSAEGLSIQAIGVISSVALKAKENCLLVLSEALEVPFITHSTTQLAPFTKYFEGSDFVEKTTGIRSIAGPSAYILCEDALTFKTFKKEKCTFSFGRIEL